MLWVDQAFNEMIAMFTWAYRITLRILGRATEGAAFTRGGYTPATLEVTEYTPPKPVTMQSRINKLALYSCGGIFLFYLAAFSLILLFNLLDQNLCLGLPVAAGYVGILYAGWRWYQRRRKKSSKFGTSASIASWQLSEAQVYAITLPRSMEWDPAKAHQFMSHMLTTCGGGLAFQIVAETDHRIHWQIIDIRAHMATDAVLHAIRSFYPEAVITPSRPYEDALFTELFYRRVMKFGLTRIFPAPLPHAGDLKEFDPLNSLTTAMSELQAGERIVYTVYVADVAYGADDAGRGLIHTSNINLGEFATIPGSIDATVRGVMGTGQVAQYDPRLQHPMLEKLANPLYKTLVLFQLDTPSQERSQHLATLGAHLLHFSRPEFNELGLLQEAGDIWVQVDSAYMDRQTDCLDVLGRWVTNQDLRWKDVLLVLEPRELAALWHLPHQHFSSSTIQWLSGRHTPLPEPLENSREGVCLGDNHYAGRVKPVYMQAEARAAHMIVFGKTEMGKSTLLHSLIRQDIAAGHGVAVIDPHRNLVRDILQTSIPPERENDVVVWDLANREYPPPLNPLAGLVGHDRLQGANQVMTILEKIYADFGATRMGYNLNKALQTVMADDTPTLMDVARVTLRVKMCQWLTPKLCRSITAQVGQWATSG